MAGINVKVYDPAMCCSTGVCGPSVDPELVRFAQDVAWLKQHDVNIERFNLAQEPAAFVQSPAVMALMQANDASILPIILIKGQVVATGAYPTRQELAALVGISEED